MIDEQIPGVDAMRHDRIPAPPTLKERAGQVKYEPVKLKSKCADCTQIIYEQTMHGERSNPAIAETVRWKRTRGKNNPERLICITHHIMRLELGT